MGSATRSSVGPAQRRSELLADRRPIGHLSLQRNDDTVSWLRRRAQLDRTGSPAKNAVAPCWARVQYCRPCQSRNHLSGMAADGRVLPTRWMIYNLAFKQTWIGEIDGLGLGRGVKRAVMKFRHRAASLMAVQRGAARVS